ncbi:hypothetical protein AB0M87_04320 [Streptomyces sp. NPDC051320]|uniref:hypothetical protein n=1 Tax=Streptomyces sp. NPDC051320 TaxID=3154644 RepID=UPI00343B46C6
MSEASGWHTPLATRLLRLMAHDMHGVFYSAFRAHGYTHLPLPARDGRGYYLRLAYGAALTAWPIAETSVVLTITGAVDLEMYQRREDMQAGRPQYARSFGPEQVFAAHPGTLCALRSSAGGMQVLAVRQREAVPTGTLTFHEHAAVAQRARRVLEGVVVAGAGGAR